MENKKIYIRVVEEGCEPLRHEKGDWIDLRSAEDVELSPPKLNVHTNDIIFQNGMISLGVAMKLPDGYEAIVAPRSSTFKNFGIVQSNSLGVIDNSYSGTNDVWRFPYIAFKRASIKKGDRIAQFRIVPTMRNQGGVEFEYVDTLDGTDRGGFGSTGKE